jgi:flagellar motor switch protein FliM
MARIAALESRRGSDTARLPVNEDLLAALGKARVEVEAVLTGSTLRMSDLLAMEPGQIVTLGQPANTPLHCRINGVNKFCGELIQNRERAALLIERPADVRDEEPAAPRRNPS